MLSQKPGKASSKAVNSPHEGLPGVLWGKKEAGEKNEWKIWYNIKQNTHVLEVAAIQQSRMQQTLSAAGCWKEQLVAKVRQHGEQRQRMHQNVRNPTKEPKRW
jgi:hypothetical protein